MSVSRSGTPDFSSAASIPCCRGSGPIARCLAWEIPSVTNSAKIIAAGDQGVGILAQSVGGGGGNGAFAITAGGSTQADAESQSTGCAGGSAGNGGEAPAYVCWGHNSRSALVRVPMYKPQKGNSTRLEFRSVDAACNPYLAFSVILAAGLKGIEKDYELPPGAEDDVWALTSAERRAMGIKPLPSDLNEAIRVMESSDIVAEALGEHVFDFFLRNKREEWSDYRRQVTRFELDRYLPML